MENDDKCAHEMCSCIVGKDEDYCSDHCDGADDQDIVEIKCDCGHPTCG